MLRGHSVTWPVFCARHINRRSSELREAASTFSQIAPSLPILAAPADAPAPVCDRSFTRRQRPIDLYRLERIDELKVQGRKVNVFTAEFWDQIRAEFEELPLSRRQYYSALSVQTADQAAKHRKQAKATVDQSKEIDAPPIDDGTEGLADLQVVPCEATRHRIPAPISSTWMLSDRCINEEVALVATGKSTPEVANTVGPQWGMCVARYAKAQKSYQNKGAMEQAWVLSHAKIAVNSKKVPDKVPYEDLCEGLCTSDMHASAITFQNKWCKQVESFVAKRVKEMKTPIGCRLTLFFMQMRVEIGDTSFRTSDLAFLVAALGRSGSEKARQLFLHCKHDGDLSDGAFAGLVFSYSMEGLVSVELPAECKHFDQVLCVGGEQQFGALCHMTERQMFARLACHLPVGELGDEVSASLVTTCMLFDDLGDGVFLLRGVDPSTEAFTAHLRDPLQRRPRRRAAPPPLDDDEVDFVGGRSRRAQRPVAPPAHEGETLEEMLEKHIDDIGEDGILGRFFLRPGIDEQGEEEEDDEVEEEEEEEEEQEPPAPPAPPPLPPPVEEPPRMSIEEKLLAEGIETHPRFYRHVASGADMGKVQGPFFGGSYKACCAKHGQKNCSVLLNSKIGGITSDEITGDLVRWLAAAHNDPSMTSAQHLALGRQLKLDHGMKVRG